MKRRTVIAGLGSAAAWPLAANAQQSSKVNRIAIVHPSTPIAELTEGGSSGYRFLLKELRRLGHVEGENLAVERYSGHGQQAEHYAELAREVVRRAPDLIVTNASRLVLNFKEATSAIPIVGLMADPIAFGIVSGLARPGGNITGISVEAGLEIWGKRLQLLRQAIPGASRMGYLLSQDVSANKEATAVRQAAGQLGISLIAPPLEAPVQDREYRRVFEVMIQERPDALIISDQAEHVTYRRLIVDLANDNRLPAMYYMREYVEIGGFMAYGISTTDQFIRVASYVDKILKGAKPADLPIEQPTKFNLAINLKTAKALGLTIPPNLLAFADEVIE